MLPETKGTVLEDSLIAVSEQNVQKSGCSNGVKDRSNTDPGGDRQIEISHQRGAEAVSEAGERPGTTSEQEVVKVKPNISENYGSTNQLLVRDSGSGKVPSTKESSNGIENSGLKEENTNSSDNEFRQGTRL